MASHDHAYKLLFSHPRLVRDLIVGFVHENRRAAAHLHLLEKASAHFVSDRLRTRTSDMIWRIRARGDEWVYLLLEFQSTVERFMAVRVLAYVALLYQDLIKSRSFWYTRLPPVFPIVMYNGRRRWNPPTSLSRLIRTHVSRPKGFRPHVRYKLINVRGQCFDAPHLKRNLAAALFRIENSRSRAEVREHVRALLPLLRGDDMASLRRAFSVWINDVVLARLPGGRLDGTLSLEEMMQSLLDERFDQWERQLKATGMRAGLRKGRREGERNGLRRGFRAGKAELLLTLLRGRFGDELPQWVQRRVQDATSSQLNRLGTRLLGARTLRALFRRAAQSR